MLTNLTVKNLALFKDITVDFQKGLNIMTGETGAGKSILIGSVLLALGGRYTSDMIRSGEKAGFVELVFSIDNDFMKEELLKTDDELDLSDGLLIISRRLMDGRSVSRVNGENVTQKQLRGIASVLLDVYGQRDAQILLDSGGQGTLLDDFGADVIKQAKEETAKAYRDLQITRKQINEIGEDRDRRQREIDLLAYEIQEIEQAQLRSGEDEELENEFTRLSHAQQITEGLAGAREALDGGAEGGASGLMARSLRELGDIRRFDDHAGSLYDQLLQADELVSDITRELSSYLDQFDFSPQEADRIGSRLDLLNRLKNKYNGTLEEINALCTDKRERLALLERAEETLDELGARRREQEEILRDKCAVLTEGRKRFAALMAHEISDSLKELNFADNRFEIRVEPSGPVTSDGCDEIIFMIGPNPGEPMRELSKIASGGELSRIMLAVKTVMAGREAGKTLIFDEIDAGISGRTAGAVAERLCAISLTHQVICITHLAQIASMADAHYLIEKEIKDTEGIEETITHIRQIGEDEAAGELARILGGTEITPAAVNNAKEMLSLAKTYKEKHTVRDF